MAKVEINIDGPYAPLPNDLESSTLKRVEAVMLAGMTMNTASGLRLPYRIPPAVALAIVQSLERT